MSIVDASTFSEINIDPNSIEFALMNEVRNKTNFLYQDLFENFTFDHPGIAEFKLAQRKLEEFVLWMSKGICKNNS